MCTAAVRALALTGAEVDRRVLGWIGRFRFVTAALSGDRFGVSVQMTRVRLRLLEREGLLARERARHTEEHAVFLTPAGARMLGLPRRRVHVHRQHEWRPGG